jgi:hypothetical protein
MITVGEKLLILGGQGPTGPDTYEDAIVELDTSKLVFPPEMRIPLETPRIQSGHLQRTHSLYESNTGDRKGIPEPSQVARAASAHLSAQKRYSLQQSDTSQVTGVARAMYRRNAMRSNHIGNQRQRARTRTRAAETTIQTRRDDGSPSEIVPSPLLPTASASTQPSGVRELYVENTRDVKGSDLLKQKYSLDDEVYIPRPEGNDLELLNFISTSEVTKTLKLVVLEPRRRGSVTDHVCGVGDAAKDGMIEYQRPLNEGGNGAVHLVTSFIMLPANL